MPLQSTEFEYVATLSQYIFFLLNFRDMSLLLFRVDAMATLISCNVCLHYLQAVFWLPVNHYVFFIVNLLGIMMFRNFNNYRWKLLNEWVCLSECLDRLYGGKPAYRYIHIMHFYFFWHRMDCRVAVRIVDYLLIFLRLNFIIFLLIITHTLKYGEILC